jgi:hypothetical protein
VDLADHVQWEIFMSMQAESGTRAWSGSSFWTKPLVWNAVVAAAVIIAIVALIATQGQPEATDYLGGNALPL